MTVIYVLIVHLVTILVTIQIQFCMTLLYSYSLSSPAILDVNFYERTIFITLYWHYIHNSGCNNILAYVGHSRVIVRSTHGLVIVISIYIYHGTKQQNSMFKYVLN